MRAVIQRVSKANVEVENKIVGQINRGFMILVGFEEADTQEDITWLVQKIVQMRLFPDEEGKMNRSLQEINGEALVISQFTLHASTKKGNRPSFIHAAKPDRAIPLYESTLHMFKDSLGADKVQSGIFGAHMQVSLINDGPVTITIDSKNKE